ncbi:lysylphosphatidylglycerol synthase transmembrane domain-containing protein [Promineifilum sp.]|uniref:lysylphosphatidylglycerol synthase transmembrane domain-containing protein n=1 Tax=Promineifilum sp. TaxID=2664178 RepID=UPI0035AD92A0
MEQTTRKGQWQLWVGLLVGVACLAAVFIFYARPAEIIESLRHVHLGYLLLGTLGVVLFLLIRAVRWRFMLGNAAPYGQVFHIQNIGYMLTQLLPLRLGDVARAILIGNVPPLTLTQGVSTMVVERLLDMLFIVVLLPFTLSGLTTLPEWMRSFALFSGFAAIGGILVLIVAANQRERAVRLAGRFLARWLPFLHGPTWTRRFDGLLAGLKSLTSPRDGLILTALSVAVWLPILLAYYYTMRAVNLEPTWTMTGFVVCAAAFSVAVPSTPGQAGPYHFAVITALQLYGQPAAESASFAFLYHVMNIVVMVLFGVLAIARTGVTFRNVLQSAQSFVARKEQT